MGDHHVVEGGRLHGLGVHNVGGAAVVMLYGVQAPTPLSLVVIEAAVIVAGVDPSLTDDPYVMSLPREAAPV